jgi:sulfide:quinone oxidoreductase
VKRSPLADPANPAGYVEIDKNTMQHARYPNVFALGDAGSSPNSKTGAAIRKQAPVVVNNLTAVMGGSPASASYDGYASCPLTTARDTMLLAEFDDAMKPAPSFPRQLLDAQKERKDMWYLKRYGLPFMYGNLMLKGRA